MSESRIKRILRLHGLEKERRILIWNILIIKQDRIVFNL